MRFLFFLFFLISFVSSQIIISPYVNQCPGDTARWYEKNFPCNWADYILIWDFQPIAFICNNAPINYSYNYSIKNNKVNNVQPFSMALFHGVSDNSDVLSSFITINNNYNKWANGSPDFRLDSRFIQQPLNSPFYTDFSGQDQIVLTTSNTILTSNPNDLGIVAFFINRENLVSQFPCFDLTISLNVF